MCLREKWKSLSIFKVENFVICHHSNIYCTKTGWIFFKVRNMSPCPGYYKQCCNEHWGTSVSFNSGFLSVYALHWNCWVAWQFYFQFLKASPHHSP